MKTEPSAHVAASVELVRQERKGAFTMCKENRNNILPQTYYKHFCKLVFAVQIINQYQIKTKDLKKAHQALVEFAHEFELLYYQH